MVMLLPWLLTGAVGLSFLIWLYINFAGAYRNNLKYRLDREPASTHDNDLPAAAILVPGRNEADHIGRTIPKLCEQDYPWMRVVFIDDDSDDATPDITRELVGQYPDLYVERNEGNPPEGWVGKCWAVHRGYERLKREEQADPSTRRRVEPEWLCFTDADIDWDESCLRTAVHEALRQEADIVALFPGLTFGSVSEAVVQLQMVLALGLLYPFERAMDPDHPDTLTGGAFILVRRSLYDQVGGHEAVRDKVIEDIALGTTLKQAGGKVRIYMGQELINCRMYDGWADMWEGLTKNTYAGIQYSPIRLVGVSLGMLLFGILVPLYPLLAGGWIIGTAGQTPLAWWVLAQSVLLVLLQARAMNKIRQVFNLGWGYAFSLPLGAALFGMILWGSVVAYYRGGNTWKGRKYSDEGIVNPAKI